MGLTRNARIGFTLMVTLLAWGQLIWNYFNGGVPVHYLFHNPDLPGISNWWGVVILPFFIWMLLYFIHKRMVAQPAEETLRKVFGRFCMAFGISVLISIFFVKEIDLIDYIMMALFFLAFLFPLYKAEFLLGWVLGSIYIFGGVIPMAFGSLLALVFLVFYKLPRLFGTWMKTRTTKT